jgi:hypothetical protein
LAESFPQPFLIDRIKVAAMRDRIVSQATVARFQEYANRQRGDAKITRHRDDNGQGAMLIADIVLDDHARMTPVISRPVAGAKSIK